MASMAQSKTKPVEDTVAKIDNEIAVGSDIEFQRRWWKFEHVAWTVLTLMVALDIAGVFGRGPVAKAKLEGPDHSYTVSYERIERYATPSILSIEFKPQAVTSGNIQLWVSSELVKGLGNERVIPQPEKTALVNNGLLYTFPAATPPDSVDFSLQPTGPGMFHLKISVPGHGNVEPTIYVVP